MYKNDIDKKWQDIWEQKKAFKAEDNSDKEKFYALIEFPYPSGVGLHVGHARAFMGMETICRKRRMQGYNVMYPIGFDAFGLPTENYAIKTGIHPRKVTDNNIATFTKQLKSIGFSFDYDRVIDTTTPEYYKWTQWIFLKLFEHGLAYKDKTYVNYCPNCRVILANEESQGGKCDRCDSEVVQKEKEVWMLRITDYADKLLEELKNLDFIPRVKLEQENWIGRSSGAEIDFNISDTNKKITVYTTRPDTIFGVTYMALAPEHKLLDELKSKIENFDEIEEYRKFASKKSEFERVQLSKEKTGVEVKGIKVINPVTKELVPVWITDYVMLGYGTGAIMAVPAHDERDYEFATKFGIKIIPVIEQITGEKRENEKYKESIVAVVYNPNTNKYLTINWNKLGGRLFIGGTKNENESSLECALREITEETGYKNLQFVNKTFDINHHYFAHNKNQAYEIEAEGMLFNLINEEKISTNLDADEENNFKVEWVSKDEIEKEINDELHKTVFNRLINPCPYIGEGKIINSEILNGLNVKEAKEKAIQYLEQNNFGKRKTNYHMKDWAFARQRYWGEPVPIVKCEKCGLVALKESELPLKLPEVDNFIPGEDGESPLAKVESWVNTKCPHCGGPAKRETDTMPQWAGSSWYFLRYIDPKNDKELASQDKLKYWLQVDWYNGGMEHVTRHLIYSRFWHRFLYDIGVVPTKEPYAKRTAQGLILGPDGEKMSKSRGNVVNPDDIVEKYGADTLRTYVLFIGEYSQSAPWSENGVKGAKKFLDRVMRLDSIVTNEDITSKELEREINLTIKKVTSDIEEMKYNTAIAAMMSYVNTLYKKERVSKKYIKPLLQILNPIAPHVTEELWEKLGFEGYVFESVWPQFDDLKIVTDSIEMAVQINGVVRFKINVDSSLDEKQIEELVLNDERTLKYIDGKIVRKVIVIKQRIVNVVV